MTKNLTDRQVSPREPFSFSKIDTLSIHTYKKKTHKKKTPAKSITKMYSQSLKAIRKYYQEKFIFEYNAIYTRNEE